MNEYNDDRLEKVSSLASRVLDIARNTLIIKLRSMDKAINMLKLEESSLFPLAVDGKNIYYHPLSILT